MADSAVVPGSPGASLRCSSFIEADVDSPSLSTRDFPSTSCDGIKLAGRLEGFSMIRLQGFSKPLVNILLASNRPATHAAYGSAWGNWANWCLRRSENPLSLPLNSVLQFLASLHTEGKAYSTINVHRSMLSSTLPHVDNRPIGQHPLVKSLMSGCYNINPPKPRYESIWDPELVVRFVSGLGENSQLSIKNLSLKTVTLIALASLLRVSEMAIKNQLRLASQLVQWCFQIPA